MEILQSVWSLNKPHDLLLTDVKKQNMTLFEVKYIIYNWKSKPRFSLLLARSMPICLSVASITQDTTYAPVTAGHTTASGPVGRLPHLVP